MIKLKILMTLHHEKEKQQLIILCHQFHIDQFAMFRSQAGLLIDLVARNVSELTITILFG